MIDMDATLVRITVYPMKSLDGVSLDQSKIVGRGALEWDRRWAIVDESGELVNAKRSPRIQTVRCEFSHRPLRVSFPTEGSKANYELESQPSAIAKHLSGLLGREVSLIENPDGGFPDDPDASGPTLVSTASLKTVAEWFDISLDECRRRFRANLEIDGVPAFWEEQLYGKEGPKSFQVGSIGFLGQNPCQRCAVPTRDSLTGTVTPLFAKTFGQKRESTLPAWAPKERFDHFYRFSVNTNVVESNIGKILRVGDIVTYP
jgi:uncharacterized protein